MHFIDLIIIILLIPITISVVYLYFLAFVGVTRKKRYPEQSRNYNFLVLVPAHNEEQHIARTIESLKKLESTGKVEIVVIADNCTDSTADVARNNEVKVLVRSNEDQRGKGYALHWAMSKIDISDYDAVVIVDADTIVDSNMLSAMSQSFETGAGAVQVYNSFLILQKTHLSYLQLMANIAENILFYKARSILNLPILLRGTGMAIKSEVLLKHPWNSFSLTEDVDYAVNILKQNIKIDFNVDAAVYSGAASSYQQSSTQKIRWASGTATLIKEKVFGLIAQGIKKKDAALVELGFSFFLLSRPLLIYFIMPALVLCYLATPDMQVMLVLWGVLLVTLLIFYNLSGIFFIKDKWSALKAFFFIPVYGVWFFYIQITAIFKSDKLGWNRTERKNNE